MLRTISLFGAVFTAVMLLSGCFERRTFDYANAASAYINCTYHSRGCVETQPFVDSRQLPFNDIPYLLSINEKPVYSEGSYSYGWILLFPYGKVTSTQPEKFTGFLEQNAFVFNLPDDLRFATYTGLKYSNLFSRVARYDDPDDNTPAAYIFTGRVFETRYTGRRFTYGLSFIAPLFWAFGVPNGRSDNDLSVEFLLYEKETGNLLWNYIYHGTDYYVHNLYRSKNHDTEYFAELFRRGLNAALYDLNAKLPELDKHVNIREYKGRFHKN